MNIKSTTTEVLIIAIFCFLSLSISAAPPYPLPAIEDTSYFGKYIQRTMKLLSTSTMEKRNTVKILVYGQSISEQAWSDSVKVYLNKKFPSANIIMINRAIGGYASQELKKPTYMDIPSFYPDLVIFHVYGSHYDLDTIMHTIRRTTTAEVLLQNSHVGAGDAAPNSWEDTYGFTHIPNIANKYSCEYANIRSPWKKYLSDNTKTANDLTSDGTHLNDHGNFLMAKLVERYLFDNPKYKADTFNSVRSYKVGTDIFWENGTLTLPFSGNKIEIIADNPIVNMDSATVLIDNRKPSEFKETRMHYRPNVPYNYDWKINTPWGFGGPMRISSGTNLLDETWTITITGKTPISGKYKIDFNIGGSKIGFDGSGSFTTSSDGHIGNTFISNSKRVIIRPIDWWYFFNQNHYSVGAKFTWQVLKFFNDSFLPPLTVNPALESVQVLAQGIVNGPHTLVLSATGLGNVPIKEIRVYQPYYDRFDPSSVPKLVMQTFDGFCFLSEIDITNKYYDAHTVSGITTYWKDSLATQKFNTPTLAGIPGKYWIKKTATLNASNFDIKPIVLKSIDCTPQLRVTNPDTVCSPLTVDITHSYIDLVSISGIVDFYYDANADSILYHPEAITASGTYFVYKSNDSSAVNEATPVEVVIRNCGFTALQPFKEGVDVDLYPNPTNGTINFRGLFSGNISITDLFGNQVINIINVDLKANNEIDLSKHPKGIYFVRFTSSGNSIVKKLVLE